MENQYLKFKNSRFYAYFDMLVEEAELLRRQNVNMLFFQTPLQQNIQGLSEFQKTRLNEWEFDFNHISEEDCNMIRQIYPPDISTDYLQQLYDGAIVYEKNKVKYLADFTSKYVNVINGKRYTVGQPEHYSNRVYIFGQCTARGTGVEDGETIPSFLQSILNDKKPNTFQVINMAIGCGSDLFDDIMHMKETNFEAGDFVVLLTNLEIVPIELFQKNHIMHFDTSEIFSNTQKYGEWFTDSTFHTNAKGNKVIADYIFKKLNETEKFAGYARKPAENKFESYQTAKITNSPETVIPEELRGYIDNLHPYKEEGINGCIVMNCNPFTYGHQFLIEYAAERVDHLYVFVVEEDKSFFRFADRIELVRKGTAHIKNVRVLPSGKYMISALTFPGYFIKDGNKEIEADAALDIEIFGKYIAPALKITMRFVGEEPNDFVTRKYNEEMRETLPVYGIELVTIARKRTGDNVISATRVRQLLKERKFDEIKALVPPTTLAYLRGNYET